MLIYAIIKIKNKFFFIYVNFMIIYVKKLFYGRTDRRTTQNYSSEPHNNKMRYTV
jgi:hypothetical protein